jgi:hypothetical protein
MAKSLGLLKEFKDRVRRAREVHETIARLTKSIDESRARTRETISESRVLLAKLDRRFI